LSSAPPPLSELRARCRAADTREDRRRLLRDLRGDGRSGALAIAALLARRARAERAEARRLARLFALRGRLIAAGARLIAGVDEVGMGPLAGPVVAAAVILPERPELDGLDDSKRLTREQRERLAERIHAQALAVGLGIVEADEIDVLNIYRAGLEAMRRAVAALAAPPDHVLVDARTIPDLACAQTAIAGGDALDGSIAAASIVAKVARDAIMRRLDESHPGFGLARHMGYATRQHLDALRRLGPSPIHRRSFAPVTDLLDPQARMARAQRAEGERSSSDGRMARAQRAEGERSRRRGPSRAVPE
jgi:ribonuclease HII